MNQVMPYLLVLVAIAIGVALWRLGTLNRKITHMGNKIDDKLTAIDNATNAVAAEIATLRGELADVATPDQLTRMDALATRLTSIAADPVNPVPDPSVSAAPAPTAS